MNNIGGQMNDQDRFEYEVMSEMEQSPELGELFAALSKAQGVMEGAVKDSTNPFFKSKYADLYQVWEAIRKPLSDNGLSIIQTTSVRKQQLFVVTTIGHLSGQWMKSYTPVKTKDETPQAMGSAITYARRYGLAAIAGVAQMDDDAESAMNRSAPKEPVFRFKAGQKEEIHKQVLACLEDGDEHGLNQILSEYTSVEAKMAVWALFNSRERDSIKKLTGANNG